VAWAKIYLHIKWHLDPSSHFATIDMGGKVGGGAVPLPREAGSLFNNVAWAEAYLRTKWHLYPSSRLATTDDMGRKLGGRLCPFGGMSLSNAM